MSFPFSSQLPEPLPGPTAVYLPHFYSFILKKHCDAHKRSDTPPNHRNVDLSPQVYFQWAIDNAAWVMMYARKGIRTALVFSEKASFVNLPKELMDKPFNQADHEVGTPQGSIFMLNVPYDLQVEYAPLDDETIALNMLLWFMPIGRRLVRPPFGAMLRAYDPKAKQYIA